MRKIIITIIIILSIITPALAERPSYSFSESIFNQLPPYPDDLAQAADLLAYQSITAEQLNASYYQPEILPTWDYWAEKVYADDAKSFCSYGVFIYPSLFNIINVVKGDSFNISALLYTNFGVEKYQGLELIIPKKENLSISLIEPESPYVLLKPTAPSFHMGWMRLFILHVDVLETGNYTIKIKEKIPPQTIDQEWSTIYGDDYISGGSLMSQKVSKCTINIIQSKSANKQDNDNNKQEQIDRTNKYLAILVLTIIFIIIFAYYVKRRKEKQKKA